MPARSTASGVAARVGDRPITRQEVDDACARPALVDGGVRATALAFGLARQGARGA
jgi:hypothetical protein